MRGSPIVDGARSSDQTGTYSAHTLTGMSPCSTGPQNRSIGEVDRSFGHIRKDIPNTANPTTAARNRLALDSENDFFVSVRLSNFGLVSEDPSPSVRT